MKQLLTFLLALFFYGMAGAQTISPFDNINLLTDSFNNGKDLSGGFSSGNAYFINNYDTSFGGVWSGFAMSNKKDTITAGHLNQYSCFAGSGYKGSPTFAVANAYGDVKIRLTGAAKGKALQGVYVTNTTYAALSVKNGDGIGKKFGGASGNDPDFFKIRVSGWYNGTAKTDTLEFYLADYRSSDNSKDYIVKSWTWFDLKGLGNVDSLCFFLTSSDVGSWGMNTPAYFCIDNFITRNHPVFAPGASHPATTAIHADSNVFKQWAVKASITKGYQDISNTSLGMVTVGDSTMALGKAGSNAIVSLGDGGQATMQFGGVIYNGPGADFAIFENSFADNYLELGFVEVSSDGQNFFRFPAISLTDTTVQVGPFDTINPVDLNNFAGKYRSMYGTPFDLDELKNTPNLNVDKITHVRIVDVVGSLNTAFAKTDAEGRMVNDPWPTAFASSGFDLDAVGVIHFSYFEGVGELAAGKLHVWPNPTQGAFSVEVPDNGNGQLEVYDITGRMIHSQYGEGTVKVDHLQTGIYILKLSTGNQVLTQKLIVR